MRRYGINGRALLYGAFVIMALVLLPVGVLAQETPTPKADIFGGYAYAHPGVDVPAVNNRVPKGFGAAITINANRWLGFTVDGGGHFGDNFNIGTLTAGPRLKFRSEKAAPFLEALAGLNRLGLQTAPDHSGLGVMLGGGIDLPLSRHIEFRPIQADYMWAHHSITGLPNTLNLSGARVRSGVVLNLGGGPAPVPMSATCSAQPTEVFDGEPVTVTTAAQNVPKNHTVMYAFNTTGGQLQSKDNTANVDTTGMTPGSYRVTATVTDPKARKAVPATCDASFTIRERPKHPPTITCSASATTVKSGEPVTITCTSQNPDNRPQLTYDWNASGGKLAPNQTTATLDTTGAPAGPISVTTKVTDDRGLNAATTTTVNVEVPPPPPQASKVTELAFKPRSARVDNVAKAILDDVALRLQREADARAVIIGFFDPASDKQGGEKLAAQRAVNAKAYLTQDKGIDPARIEVRTGTAGGTRAEVWMVPAGATLDTSGTIPVDEGKVKPEKSRSARRIHRAKAAPKQAAPRK